VNVRRAGGAALLALTALCAPLTGCSDDKAAGTTTTTAKGTAPVKGAEKFTDNIAKATKLIDEAGGDPCKLVGISATLELSNPPTKPDEVKAAVEFAKKWYGALASTIEKDEPAAAQTIRDTADALAAKAKADGYPASAFGADSMTNSTEFAAALQKLSTTTACKPSAATGG
jgi:hypothetical protein